MSVITIWDRLGVLRRGKSELPERVEIGALTFGDAIHEAERRYGVPIRPATTRDKYFIVGDEREEVQGWLKRFLGKLIPGALNRPRRGGGNTDIHILRDGVMQCPKHDLDFGLRKGDVVVFEILLC